MNLSFNGDSNNIPLADDDPQVIVSEDSETDQFSSEIISKHQSNESIHSNITNHSSFSRSNQLSNTSLSLEQDLSPDEQEEKVRLITQILELQNALDDLSQRVDSVKEENIKLKTENQVLNQYIENLMSASSVFQSTSPKIKKK